MNNKFWHVVEKCDHKNLSPNYCEHIYCETPYCSGIEEHCLDCGIYLSDCGCHSNQGISGWSNKRWLNFYRKKKWIS